SGSPASTTSRAGDTGVGAVDAVARMGASGADGSLPDFGRSAIAKSCLVESFSSSGLPDPAELEIDRSRGLAAFAAPAVGEAGFATEAAAGLRPTSLLVRAALADLERNA